MKTVASMKPLYVDVKIRKQGEQYELLADCDCGETHKFSIGIRGKYYSGVNGIKKAPCGRMLFTTLDTNDQESNANTYEVLRLQGAKWRCRKAHQSIKRNKKLRASILQIERDFLIEKHYAAIKAIKESPGLLESLKQMENEYLQQNERL